MPAADVVPAIADVVDDHNGTVTTSLADTVLPLVRTRADLHTWRASNAHGAQMQEAVSILAEAAATDDPAEVFVVTQKAIASSLKVIMRADDSSGIIGDAIRGLLTLHADLAPAAQPAPTKLVDWMITFQFHSECDFFTIDPIRYAPALGEVGVVRYRHRLDEIRAGLAPVPDDWHDPDGHARFMLGYNDRRLAVLDRDVEAIIATHARDQGVAARLHDTANALEEIDEHNLAIDWAHRASTRDPWHQAQAAAETWCDLLAAHRPDEFLAARVEVFRRWPSSSTAARLYQAADDDWADLRDEVTDTLARSPRDAVAFSLNTLDNPELAWTQAHAMSLADGALWLELIKRYERIDPIAVLDPLTALVHSELEVAGAGHYKTAARHLKRMRKLAAESDRAEDVDDLIAELRETHRRRSRLQTEFDRAGLP